MADSGKQWTRAPIYSNSPYGHVSALSSSQASPYPYSSQASGTAASTRPTFSHAQSLSRGSPIPHISDAHSLVEEDTAIYPVQIGDPQLMNSCIGSPVLIPYQGAKPSQAVHEAFYNDLDLSRHATLAGIAATSIGPSQLADLSTNEQQMSLDASCRMRNYAYGNNGEFNQPDHLSPYQNPQLPLYPNAAAPADHSGQGTTTFAPEPLRLLAHQSSIECENCQKLFKGKYAKHNLDRHVRNKHPNKPTTDFVCLGKKDDGSDCNTRFGSLYNVTRHLKGTHKMAIASNPGRNKVDRTSFKHMFKEVPRSSLTVKADKSDTSEWLRNERMSELNWSSSNVTGFSPFT
ncbi:hypothetical protein N7G274_008119 [Stereocaulon virgatum]|uniref:C2H2-type domain-containing protein n=1 Tax=Stereocaulon virgatum TaxID=373712 RepID=A0ABR4A0U8_9LECA